MRGLINTSLWPLMGQAVGNKEFQVKRGSEEVSKPTSTLF